MSLHNSPVDLEAYSQHSANQLTTRRVIASSSVKLGITIGIVGLSLLITAVVSWFGFSQSPKDHIVPSPMQPSRTTNSGGGLAAPFPTPVFVSCLMVQPPLYENIKWTSIVTRSLIFKASSGKEVLLDAYDIESEPLKDKPYGFIEYYKEKLPLLGWVNVTDYHGEIADARWYRYEKSGCYITFGYYRALAGQPGYRASIEHN